MAFLINICAAKIRLMAKLWADVFLFIQDVVVSQQLPKYFHLCYADLTHNPHDSVTFGRRPASDPCHVSNMQVNSAVWKPTHRTSYDYNCFIFAFYLAFIIFGL